MCWTEDGRMCRFTDYVRHVREFTVELVRSTCQPLVNVGPAQSTTLYWSLETECMWVIFCLEAAYMYWSYVVKLHKGVGLRTGAPEGCAGTWAVPGMSR